jgi:hypothetical protein
VRLELSVSGGTVGTVTGTTDSNGDFGTTAKLIPPATTVTVTVTARAGANGPVLATKQFKASTNAGPHVELLSRRAGAVASGTATVGQDDGSQQTVNDTHTQVAPQDTIAPFSGSASASGRASDPEGDFAAFTGSADVDLAFSTSSGTSLNVQSGGSCDDQTDFNKVVFPREVSTSMESGGSIELEFSVAGGPLHYDLSSNSDGVDVRDETTAHNIAVGTATGTLDPGKYVLQGFALCGSDEKVDYTLSFQLTPP